MNDAVAKKSAEIWKMKRNASSELTEFYLNMFRFSTAPYCLVGRSGSEFICKIISRDEWIKKFEIVDFISFPRESIQAEVGWKFIINERETKQRHSVSGHVQIRWSHGKNFTKNCESKVYLNKECRHENIPGYESIKNETSRHRKIEL